MALRHIQMLTPQDKGFKADWPQILTVLIDGNEAGYRQRSLLGARCCPTKKRRRPPLLGRSLATFGVQPIRNQKTDLRSTRPL